MEERVKLVKALRIGCSVSANMPRTYRKTRVFSVKQFCHGLLVDFQHGAIGHCGCGAQAERLPRKATFSEEIADETSPTGIATGTDRWSSNPEHTDFDPDRRQSGHADAAAGQCRSILERTPQRFSNHEIR